MGKILLVGSEGSIGKRYQAIIRYIGMGDDLICYDTRTCDPDYSLNEFYRFSANEIDKVIITTPTPTHKDVILSLLDSCTKQPAILCEKPICRNLNDLTTILERVTDIQMVLQYHFADIFPELDPPPIVEEFGDENTLSSYDYYHTGDDGIYWDLIQLIGLHGGGKDQLSIRNNSPSWECTLNDNPLLLDEMQDAYIYFLKGWLTGQRLLTKQQIILMHKKVIEYKEYCESHNRNPSKEHIDTPAGKSL